MNTIDILFTRMDTWRHFPAYQLERRADVFFSLYLPEVLEAKLGFAVRRDMIPEFPVRIGTIYPPLTTERSKQIDYLALSADGDKAVFVELKTEGHSRSSEQDEYLAAARDVGLRRLLEGLLKIFRATNRKRKYFYLLEYLEDMELVGIPKRMKDIMDSPNPRGMNEASVGIQITTRATDCIIVYVQPNGLGSNVISFQDFRAIVLKHDDPVSQRFAQSLLEWAQMRA